MRTAIFLGLLFVADIDSKGYSEYVLNFTALVLSVMIIMDIAEFIKNNFLEK